MKKWSDPSLLAIILIGVVVFWINNNVDHWKRAGGVIMHDVISYYAYLPAAFIYRDLTLEFTKKNPQLYESRFWPEPAPNNRMVIKTSMGMSLMYLPAFLAGHATAKITGQPADGFSAPYKFYLLWFTLVYVIIAMMLLRKLLLRHFNRWAVALALLSVFFGTNFLYYATFEATMPHAYNFFLFAVFLYLTVKWYEKPELRTALLLGLTAGMISLVRPSNVIIGLVFLLYGAMSFNERLLYWKQHWTKLTLMLVMAVAVWIPQMVYWKIQTGYLMWFSYTGERFFFDNPQIINGLFNFRKGWLIYSPVMALSLIGFAMLYFKARQFFVPVLLFTIVNIYVIYSWWSWWYGGSFGSRPMIDSYALLVLPMAAFIERCIGLSNRFLKVLTLKLLVLLSLYGVFTNIQYYYDAIHYDSMTREAWLSSFGRIRPAPNFEELLGKPDYALAKQGIQATIPRPVVESGSVIEFNFEFLKPGDQQFFSRCYGFNMASGFLQSAERVRTGHFSLKIPVEHPYQGRFEIETENGGRYKITAWRYPAGAEHSMVFSDLTGKIFYTAVSKESKTEKKWGLLELAVDLTKAEPGTYILYF
ncbi:MAG TPA: hypothetical protein VLH16_03990, partial [Bacteroidales bacterium]|nr:hypothetical protein [Bacteroidales bacterium]